jgi:lipopolysaccharide export system protein LptA
MKRKLIFLLLFFISTYAGLYAQVPSATSQGQDTAKTIRLIRADKYRRVKKDSLTELNMLIGNVLLQQGTTLFSCDSAVQNTTSNQIEAFGNVHINDADSVHTYSQYLKYLGNSRMAYLQKKVKLTDGKGTLTTEELEYDMNSRIGSYKNNGKVVNGTTVLTSREGYYYADTKEAYFMQNVKLIDPEYTMATDTLLYNIDSSLATFVSPTTINDGRSTIKTRSGYYDMKNGTASFGSRPVIEDSTQQIIADNIVYDKKSGEGHADGSVVYRDTAQGVTILAGDTRFNNKDKQVLATQKPVMIIKQDKDSIYIAADTLISSVMAYRDMARANDSVLKKGSGDSSVKGRISDTDTSLAGKTAAPGQGKEFRVSGIDSNSLVIKDSSLARDTMQNNIRTNLAGTDSIRIFRAYHHVRIFSDSLQGVCDSLYYSSLDSAFRMYKDPLVWSNENQLSGDTIYLFTKNKKPDHLFVFENSFAISRTKENFLNQIKGNRINGNFVNGNIDFMRAKGNAESIYYLQDSDSAYIGMNYARADAISMYFGKDGLKRVSWVNGVEGTTFPMNQIPEEKKSLRNVKWLDNRRPKTWLELFQ